MNQAPILTPVAKGYSSKDYLNAKASSGEFSTDGSSFKSLAKYYSAGAVAYVKINPVKAAVIAAGVLVLVTGFIYRSKIASQFRNRTQNF